MKQQDLNRMAIFLGHKLPIPQEEHIADTINKIEAILQKKTSLLMLLPKKDILKHWKFLKIMMSLLTDMMS